MRRYCSRCLQTIGALDPEHCPGPDCRSGRPARGWPSFLSEGTTIDERFIVHEILGAGGAGITYRCEDLVDDQTSALKVLHDDRRHGVLANRLAIEGELLELLVHPHIVPFHGLRLIGDGPVYLATRYMPGGSLEGALRRGGPLSPAAVVSVGRQLALALDFIHSQGIVHRDLKPGNVLIERTEPGMVVRLADFGIARVFRNHRPMAGLVGLTRTGMFIGTPEYAAPEQIRGEKGIGPAADAFALGALLHYAACGGALLKRSEMQDWTAFRDRRRDPSDRPRLVDEVPAGLAVGYREELLDLDAIIDALMHPDADARVSLADVALTLGASKSQLASRDLTPLAPRSLVSSLDDGWFNDDGVDALVPHDDAPDELEPSEPAPITPEEAALPNLAELISVPAVSSGEPTMVVPRRAVPAPSSNTVVPPPSSGLPDPDPNSRPDWDDDEIDWPTPRRRRRNRMHAALMGLAAMFAGGALAWPGGVPALIGEDSLDGLEDPVRGWIDTLAVDEPTYTTQSPWDGKRVLTSGARTPAPSSVLVRAAPRVEPPVARSTPKRVEPQAERRVEPQPERRVEPQPQPARVQREEPAPVLARAPEPEPAPVDGWARDRRDSRELPEVVKLEVGRAHAEWIEDLVDRYDERAEKYQRDAENDEIRRAALFRAWDRQVVKAGGITRDEHVDDHEHGVDCSTEEHEVADAGR